MTAVSGTGSLDARHNDSSSDYPSAGRANYILILLVAACIAAGLNLQIFALLVTPVKATLDLSDGQIGILQGFGFYLTNGLVGIPLGLAIDRYNRIRFFALIAVGWGGFTALSAFAGNFAELFACRAGVGVAEAGMYTAAYSLIADLYPSPRRASGIFVFYGAVLLGAGIASYLAGLLIGFFDTHPFSIDAGRPIPSWRLTVLIVSTPAVLIAGLFLGASEPHRQREKSTEAAASAADPSILSYARQHGALLVRIFGAVFMALLGFQALILWLPTLLTRAYGVSTGGAGEWFGLIFGGGSLVGVLSAAWIAHVARTRDPVSAALLGLRWGVWGIAVASPLLLLAHDIYVLSVIWFALTALAYIVLPNGPNLVTAIAPSHLRGRILSVYNLSLILAATLAPAVVGMLSDRIFPTNRGLLWSCCTIGIPTAFAAALLLKPKGS